MFVNFAGEEGPSTYVLVTAWILMHDYHTIEEPSERFKALSKIKSDVLDPVVTAMEEDSDVATENAASAVPKNVKVWIRNNIKVIEKEISSFQENIPVGEGECTQVKLGKSPRADIFIPLQSIVFRDLVAVMHSFKKTASYTEFCKLKKLSYNKILPDDFKYMEVLGKGGFGKVVHVMKRSTGQHYAMKIQAKDRLLETWGDALYNLEIERDVLVAHNSFAFIVSLRYAFQDKKYAFLALDLIQGGSLRQLIESAAGYQLEKAQVRLYVAEIVLALECLHEHEIIYRDLKPENVLLTANGHIRLADMGLAGFFYQSKYYDEDDSQRRKEIPKKHLGSHDTDCGTPLYRPPEMIRNEKYGPSVDWFQLGVFTFECLYGRLPFEIKRLEEGPYEPTRQDELDALKNKLKLPPYEDDRTASFIKGLLELDPKKRLGNDEFITIPQVACVQKVLMKKNNGMNSPGKTLGNEQSCVVEPTSAVGKCLSLHNHPFFWALEGATADHVDWEKVAQQQYVPVMIPKVKPLQTKAEYRNFAHLKRYFKKKARKSKERKESRGLDTRKEGKEVDDKLQHYFDNWDFVHIHEIKLEKVAEKERKVKNPKNHNPFFLQVSGKFNRFKSNLSMNLSRSSFGSRDS